jgi:hypothetical protein
MHVLPHAFPVEQTLQQDPVESLQATVAAGPPVALMVSATAPSARAAFSKRCVLVIRLRSLSVGTGSPLDRDAATIAGPPIDQHSQVHDAHFHQPNLETYGRQG